MLELHTFGGLSLYEDGLPVTRAALRPRPLALLAVIAASSPAGVSRDRLLALFWPESPAERARGVLRQTLYALRHDLAVPELVSGSATLHLNPAVIQSDVQRFVAALAAGDAAGATAIYRGPFLDGFHLSGATLFDEWLDARKAELASLARAALESGAGVAEAEGKHREAAAAWRRVSEMSPLEFGPVIRAMRALAAAGDRPAALREAELHARRMAAELGEPPALEVEALADELRQESRRRRSSGQLKVVDKPVASAPSDEESVGEPIPAARLRTTRYVLSSLLVIALTLLGLLWNDRSQTSRAEEIRIAVLPFRHLGLDEGRYFTAGLTEEITSHLSRLPGLAVISGPQEDNAGSEHPTRAGRRLNAHYVLDGSARNDGERGPGQRLRTAIRLIRVADDRHVWTEEFNTGLDNVFDVQGRIAMQVASALEVALGPRERRALARRPTQNLEAYNLYLQGRYLWSRRTEPDLQRAIELFREAIRIDSTYARAYAGLADAYSQLPVYANVDSRHAEELTVAAARRAIALDDNLAEAHASLGVVGIGRSSRWRESESHFRRAIELNASYATAHHWYSNLLVVQGRLDSALAEILRAASLDPLSPIISNDVAWTHYLRREFDAAITQGRRTLELHPDFAVAHFDLGQAYLASGMVNDALRELQLAVALPGARPYYSSALACAHMRAGDTSRAEALISKMRLRMERARLGPATLAVAVASGCAGRRDEAFELLHMPDEGGLAWIIDDPLLDALRTDPRFTRLKQVARPG